VETGYGPMISMESAAISAEELNKLGEAAAVALCGSAGGTIHPNHS
jgi:uridine phosphorylase